MSSEADPQVRLRPVTRAEVTIVIDNFVDVLMASLGGSYPVQRDGLGRSRPTRRRAWVLCARDGRGRRPAELDALRRRPHSGDPRQVVFPTGNELRLPPTSRQDLEAEGVDLIEERGQTFLLDSTILVSGQVERTSAFEQGFAIHYAHAGHDWEPDPMIWDDQNLIVNVEGKGLAVISGCSHAGAVNVLHNAQRLTGEKRVAGFVGGLHLTGGLFEPIIGPTVDAFVAAGIECLLPAHCTGWKAVHQFARALPDAFVQPAVGTTVSF